MGLQPQFEGVEINSSDHRLDMFIVRTKSLPGYLSVLTRLIFRRQASKDSDLRYLDVHNQIEIQSNPTMPVQADGEVIGKTPVSISLVSSALRIIVPPKKNP
jgi:diacylglycerol kinase family enzyme